VPRAAVLALAQGIAGARFSLIEDSGHATPYDQPDEFNRQVLEFLDGVP
jgi:pimeloyl-ACP methyl ester carboxylesterase